MPSTDLNLTGKPRNLVWPKICIACSAPATRTTRFSRLIEYSDDGQRYRRVRYLRVPICENCLAAHHAETRRYSAMERLLLSLRSFAAIPAAGAAFVILFIGLPGLLKGLARLNSTDVLIYGGMSFAFGIVVAACLRSAWRENEWRTVPPPGRIARSVVWTEDNSKTFERERHSYSFENPQFGQAMRELNRDRIWNPGSPAALNAAAKRRLAKYAAFAGVGALVVWGFLQEHGCTGFHTF